MRARMSGPSVGVGALGAGLAVAAVLASRASVLGETGAIRLPPAWTNAIGLAAATGALALSWLVRSRVARAFRPSARLRALLAGALGGVAVATYWGLGDDVVRYHAAEHFHYYVGAKYFSELSYSGIYACAAVAEAERVGRASMMGRRMRDLATDAVVPATTALADRAACTGRFTPERWRAFGDDVLFFRSALGPMWDRINQDHGFNPPPAWALAGGAFAALGPASEAVQTRLALLDPLLLLAAFGLVAWAFGGHVLWVALVAWGCQVPGQGTWTAGAFLRQDWLFCVVAAACLARRGRFRTAGVALASATALRIFPALLLVGPAVVIGRRAWQGALQRGDRRFVAGVFLGGVGWLAVSSAVFGPGAWRAFGEHIAVHRLAPLANHVGLRALLAQSWDGRWIEVAKPGAVDPFETWASLRRHTLVERRPLYLGLAAGLGALLVIGTWRVRRLWVALAVSTLAIVVTVDVASYYCAVFVLLGLLAARSRGLEWIGLAAVVASRAANALPVAVENPDLRYTLQSLVFVTWAAAVPVVLAWRRPRRAARVPSR